MENPVRIPEDPIEMEEYHSMTAEWATYFASQKYASKDSVWRNAVLEVLAEMNLLEGEHMSDPQKAVRAVVDEGERRVARRRSTD
jgi:hypothetical protein